MNQSFNVIVAGSRGFESYELAELWLDYYFCNKEPTAIITGLAKGADTLGLNYARNHDIPIIQMPADWNKYGKRAGYIRNEEMLKKADALIAFWNNKSHGTKHMIEIARNKGIPVRIVQFNDMTEEIAKAHINKLFQKRGCNL